MPYDDFIRYLEAKQTVDDRALNRRVWAAMQRDIEQSSGDFRVLEVGAGHGAMFHRMLEAELLERASYTAIDLDPANVEAARLRFGRVTRARELELVTGDLHGFAQSTRERWDLVVAHAVLDLLDLDQALEDLRLVSDPGGAFYFTINFDGETAFEPSIDPVLDEAIIALYHHSMDSRGAGKSHTGRCLFHALSSRGARIEEAGSSDWVVWARDGAYSGDEAYFLHFIVATVGRALRDSTEIDHRRLGWWLDERHAQVGRGELVYLAHQLDFYGRWC